MSFFTVFLLAVALSMDAFAVALASGCAIREVRPGQYLRVSLAFGFFQFFMPLLGWFLGQSVHHFIEAWDHWLAFALLAWIGGNMLRSGIGGLRRGEGPSCPKSDPTRGWNLLLLAVATSIDALAVGLTFAMTGTAALLPSCLIGMVCACISACGLFLGKKLASLPMLNGWAEVLGGLVLVGIGLNILRESGVI
ncbi:manganese efflux pump MntP family protein [uncultured Desulfovibrio sp.]|uniref:manganese efflux pump MntP n=1 Tax=uncultured Desulfovibrio sp. TaxID=167968 RepID=UPI002616FE05|nr:manganese efflux pump MntP family protein [uncultured Desulfovibrio sp.]